LSRRLNQIRSNLLEGLGIDVTISRAPTNGKKNKVNTSYIKICKMPPKPPIPPIEQNHEGNSPKADGGISSTGGIMSPVDKMPPTKNDQNDAQKSDTGGNGDIGGIFPTSKVDVGVQLHEVDTNTTASPQSFLFKCYHCDNFQTNSEGDYERHVILNHPRKPCYPSKPDLERLGLKGMGKKWEI
jgi:hypothetical protein